MLAVSIASLTEKQGDDVKFIQREHEECRWLAASSVETRSNEITGGDDLHVLFSTELLLSSRPRFYKCA